MTCYDDFCCLCDFCRGEWTCWCLTSVYSKMLLYVCWNISTYHGRGLWSHVMIILPYLCKFYDCHWSKQQQLHVIQSVWTLLVWYDHSWGATITVGALPSQLGCCNHHSLDARWVVITVGEAILCVSSGLPQLQCSLMIRVISSALCIFLTMMLFFMLIITVLSVVCQLLG